MNVLSLCVCAYVRCAFMQYCLIKEKKKGRSRQELLSRALFALRMLALIMFDVPFSHYPVCSSAVGVKSKRSTR